MRLEAISENVGEVASSCPSIDWLSKVWQGGRRYRLLDSIEKEIRDVEESDEKVYESGIAA